MIIAYCLSCNKEHDVTNHDPKVNGVKCECGGYIVSPSGKMKIKIDNKQNEIFREEYKKSIER